MTTMSEEGRQKFLASLNIDPEGESLVTVAEVEPEVKAKKAKKAKVKKAKEAPASNNKTGRPEDMSDVVFDASLLNDYTLDGSDMKAASDMLFAHYRYPRGDMRNKLLHRQITEFIQRVKRERNPQPRDGHVKKKVKAGKDKRDLAQVLANYNLTADDLAVMIEALAAHKGQS